MSSKQLTKENTMAIDYSELLTDNEKRNILKQRLTQFAAEGYQHTINKEISKDNVEAVAAADQALVLIEAAINVHLAELEKIAPEE